MLIKLPVRPRPLDNESFRGFLLRVARDNGWLSINNILEVVSTRKTRYGIVDFNKVSVDLANALGLDHESLNSVFNKLNPQYPLFDDARSIKDFTIRSPRICTLCVKERGIFEDHWSFSLITHCEKHSTRLLTHCSVCDNEYQWKTDLFERCPHCKANWDSDTNSVEETPAYQEHLSQLVNQNIDAYNFCRAMSDALLFTLRPFDSLSVKLATFPELGNDYSNVLNDAYRLIVSKEAKEAWIDQLQEQRHDLSVLGVDAVNIPLVIFERSLKCCDISDMENTYQPTSFKFDGALTESDVIVSARRAKLISNEKASDLRYQADVSTISKLCGLYSGDISTLVEMNSLTPLNPTGITRDWLFDLRELADKVSRIPLNGNLQSKSEVVDFTQLAKYSKIYGASRADVLASILNKDLQAFRDPQQTGVNAIFVWEEELLKYLTSHFDNYIKSDINIKQVAPLLSTRKEVIRNLLNEGLLQYASPARYNDMISAKSIQYFFETKLSLNRWCTENGKYTSGVPELLAEHNFQPVNDTESVPKIFIYERTPQLIGFLEKLL